MSESPIQNLDHIDIRGHRKDGGVDLVIVVSSPLENKADHLDRVGTKIQAYIREISSFGFAEEFPESGASRQILLATEHPIDQAVLTLIESFRHPAADVGVILKVVAPDYFSES